jgi:hypothetical protein
MTGPGSARSAFSEPLTMHELPYGSTWLNPRSDPCTRSLQSEPGSPRAAPSADQAHRVEQPVAVEAKPPAERLGGEDPGVVVAAHRTIPPGVAVVVPDVHVEQPHQPAYSRSAP